MRKNGPPENSQQVMQQMMQMVRFMGATIGSRPQRVKPARTRLLRIGHNLKLDPVGPVEVEPQPRLVIAMHMGRVP